jgi:hypothetical protein
MQAISIKQPWAWLIVHGFKDIENRDWWTRFRGRVLVHTGKTIDEDFPYDWAERLIGRKIPEDLFLGGVIGAVTVTDCVKESESDWFFGDYGFKLADPVVLPEPIPCRGQLGFFNVPDTVAEAIRQMAGLGVANVT